MKRNEMEWNGMDKLGWSDIFLLYHIIQNQFYWILLHFITSLNANINIT